MRALALIAALGALAFGASAASAAYPQYDSEIRAQQCTTQSCVECVRGCDQMRDERVAECRANYRRPGEDQEFCLYWAHSDHNLCLMYECGV